jgi:hypothetical protein
LISLLAVALAIILSWPSRVTHSSNPLSNQVYVWQRAWNEPVVESLLEHATNFSQIVALAAEVTWRKSEPQVIRVAVDYPSIRAAQQPAGLALRIGSFSGPFTSNAPQTRFLADLAKSLVSEAQTNGIVPTEFQLDFDCAESKLDGYRTWVEVIRQQIAPVPVCITALPSWLKRPAFKSLIASTDSYVLQVHSLERPRSLQSAFNLCDPDAAQRAVERAASFGKPFRVALPTYGYVLAFTAEGRFVGLSAEGPSLNWPSGVQLREVRSNPQQIAALVQRWTTNHPQTLQGIIWYRLPVATDRLNWRWRTLAAVMQGRNPSPELRAQARSPQPGLVEIDLLNQGEDSYAKRVQLAVRWQGARAIASDALAGFEMAEPGPQQLTLKSSPTLAPLHAGQRRTIGWIRLDQNTNVTLELQNP